LLAVFPPLIARSSHGFNELGMVPFHSFRILVPALPAVFFAIALGAEHAHPLIRRVLSLALITIALIGVRGIVTDNTVRQRSQIEDQASVLGAEAMGHLLVFKHQNDMERATRTIAGLPEELRAPAFEGVGFQLAYLYGFGHGYPDGSLAADLARLSLADRKDAVRGAYRALDAGSAQVRQIPDSIHSARVREILSRVIDGA
jgi:hypothetical protein